MSLNYRTTMKHLLLSLAAALCLSACEVTVQNPELPYVNQLVICGFANADSSVQRVTVMHTLPLTEDWTMTKALVRDAQLRLVGPGVDSPMTYDDLSEQYLCSCKVSEGAQYHLSVSWRGLNAEATAIVPMSPTVQSKGCKLLPMYDQDSNLVDIWLTDTVVAAWPENALVGFVEQTAVQQLADTTDSGHHSSSSPSPFLLLEYAKGGSAFRTLTAGTGYRDFWTTYTCCKIRCVETSFKAIDNSFYSKRDEILGSFGTSPNANVQGNGFGFFVGLSRTSQWLCSAVPK